MEIILSTYRVCGVSGKCSEPGDILDLPEREALALVANGSAERVKAKSPRETAAMATAETAVAGGEKPTGKPRRATAAKNR